MPARRTHASVADREIDASVCRTDARTEAETAVRAEGEANGVFRIAGVGPFTAEKEMK